MNTTFELIAWMPGPWEIVIIGVMGLPIIALLLAVLVLLKYLLRHNGHGPGAEQ